MRNSTVHRWCVWSSLLLAALWITACDPQEEFVVGNEVNLTFSTDTLRFDTVFVDRGSATRSLRVYNRSDQPVRIDRAYVIGQTGVQFRLNVDGVPGPVVEDIIIWDQDSIHVFVEVTVDPSQPENISPFVAEDLLVFETGDRRASVQLEAWGQNAIYFPQLNNQGVPVELSCDNGTIVWDSELPYVVFGEIFIRECALEMRPGTRVYMHGGITRNELLGTFNDGFFYTLQGGSLRILGTAERPVIIQTDRLEPTFQDEAGQWLGIILGVGSRGNIIEHARLRNSILGIYADSLSQLELRNTEIAYTASSALIGRQADIRAENCLFYDNLANAVQIILGGTLDMDYCTVANFGVDASALALTNFQNYDTDGDGQADMTVIHPLVARLRNNIFVGSRNDEVILADATQRQQPAAFRVSMEHCLVRVRDLLTSNSGQWSDFFTQVCTNCLEYDREAALFLDQTMDNYRLDTLSVAQGRALVLPGIDIDLESTARDAQPDIGCYERID